jgi:hypothetical protein
VPVAWEGLVVVVGLRGLRQVAALVPTAAAKVEIVVGPSDPQADSVAAEALGLFAAAPVGAVVEAGPALDP